MSWRIFDSLTVIGVVSALILGTLAQALAEAGHPVKLSVRTLASTVPSGAVVEVELEIQDVDNRPAPAPADLAVEVEVVLPSGQTEVLQVPIAAGESATRLEVPVDQPGVVTLRATQPQLLEGGSFINVVPDSGDQTRAPAPRVRGLGTLTVPSPASPEPDGMDAEVTASVRDAPAAAAADSPVEFATDAPVDIEIRHAPHRDLQADGRDAAQIFAFVTGVEGGAPTDIAVHLFNDGGELNPSPLLIRTGEFVGSAALTSRHVGEVSVEALAAIPQAMIVGERSFSVRYRTPVTSFELRPSPPQVSLLDMPEVVAELRGPDGNPIATDEVRRISLSLKQGHGGIQPVEVEIPVGHSVGRASFLPSWMGAVTIYGHSPGMLDRETEIHVNLPVLLLIVSAVGGLAGGLLAYLVHQRERPWRLFLGLVSGFVLYWMLLFFGLVELMPRAVALNPITTLAVSILGGWAGADVLTFATRRLGLGAAGSERQADRDSPAGAA